MLVVSLIIGVIGYLLYDKKKKEIDADNKVTVSAASNKFVLNELTTDWVIKDKDGVHLTAEGVESTKVGYILHFKIVNDTGKNIVVCFDDLSIAGLKTAPSRHTITSGLESTVDVELESGEVTAEDIESATSISIDYSVLDADTDSQITSGGSSRSQSIG